MQNKMNYREKNIQKLLNSGLNKEYQLNEQFKDDTMELLLHKVAQRKKVVQPETRFVIAFSIIWIAIIVLFLSGIRISIFLTYLIKLALGLSLVFIPVSSIILIILNKRTHEEKLV
jgi:hypothetical protein